MEFLIRWSNLFLHFSVFAPSCGSGWKYSQDFPINAGISHVLLTLESLHNLSYFFLLYTNDLLDRVYPICNIVIYTTCPTTPVIYTPVYKCAEIASPSQIMPPQPINEYAFYHGHKETFLW